ncbi:MULTISPECIES: hypothetical protein [unclassified Mesorhizobium]|uniref:hypothetical protein n=1 Tax=unclassified Mesorhizobium TaxID=325217 RepID=UPI0024150F89|nr:MULTISPECIES: hypothetical protein [unclassified Mesorhizobium]MDG4904551.1 hypothetical protein [Mesorhizobium sp. WSM4962]MDG4907685.1 hypothetical protein [Mesorhizobium sp. WSM4898]MDG4920307.1 hypothetical protein [Mesorhizobium sp. WSM4989]
MGIKRQGGPERRGAHQSKPNETPTPKKGIIDHLGRYFGAIVAAVGGLAVILGGIAAVYSHRALFGFASSHVTVRPIASTKDYIRFLAENDGNRPASIGRVSGEFRFSGTVRSAFSGNLRLDLEQDDTVVPAGGSQTLRAHFADRARWHTLESYLSSVGELKASECTFGFDIVNYDGNRERLQAAFDCGQFLGQYLNIGNGNLPLRYPAGEPPL